MLMTDIIAKKRDGGTLTRAEIAFAVAGYTRGEVPDYQMAALLMAIFLQGMDKQETALLTELMAASGERADLSAIEGVKVDKHSTGGVGDKTTLIVGPIVAACGVKVAKMSGRGLGHTGGTLDKLEAIPGLTVEIDPAAFARQVNDIGIAVVGQSGNLAPADKKLYALRDVTATVDSLPLIASSIMSKKLASGADAILLDVKTGSGAFMKTLEDSMALARAMVDIGEVNGVRTAAMITDMDTPLGHAVGNALEVAECVTTLRGEGPEDLTEMCVTLAAALLQLAGKGSRETCVSLAGQALISGAALDKLAAMVAAQGGDAAMIHEPERLPKAPVVARLESPVDGYVAGMEAAEVGMAALLLGAGRATKEDAIDPAAGLVLHKKTGDAVKKGDMLAELHTGSEALLPAARQRLLAAYRFAALPPEPTPLVYAVVEKE